MTDSVPDLAENQRQTILPDNVDFGDDDASVAESNFPDTTDLPASEAVEIEDAPDQGDQPTVEGDVDGGVGVDPMVVQSLQREIDALKAQVEDRTNQYVRIAADFENFRRRTQKEREDLEIQVKRTTIAELLPVVDNFERARAQIKPQTDAEMTIHKSYQSVYKQLIDCLKRVGVSPMRAEGAEFDPNLHEAVMREPTHEHEEGTVMEELMRGYLLGDLVLRHAMVKVAAAPEVDTPAKEGTSDNSNEEL
ncbi:MAG: nucleotide exchange factor GrpE [Synechococcales bacterium]|nr:nucleotide exchange factor GrpE [Synechococcales bacterium]